MRAFLTMVLFVAPVLGQPYTIQLRPEPDQGKSVLVRLESKQVVESTVKDADGKELKRDQRSVAEVSEYALAVQETRDGLPAKFSHEYSKAEVLAGKEKRTTPWSGRKIQFEVGKEKLTAKAVEGKALEPVAIAELEQFAATRFLDTVAPMLPVKEIKVGDEWKVEAKDAASGLRVPFDPANSTASGKFIKAYEKAGRLFGVLELKAELALKLPGGGTGKLVYAVKIDAGIDGKATEGTYLAEVTISGSQTVTEKENKRVLGGTTRGTINMEVGEQK